MNILNILKEKKSLFVLDEIENKKMQNLINAVNKNMLDMADALASFKEYKHSQLKGELHTQIVMVKSLLNEYPTWQVMIDLNNAMHNQERSKVADFENRKARLLNSLKTLLVETKNNPVVSLYDIYNDEYQLCDEGHEVIILGTHNSEIIERAINELNDQLRVSGNYEELTGVELQGDYSNVLRNAEMCYDVLANGKIKAGKVKKIKPVVDEMIECGKKVVKFATYKQCLTEIGVKEKDVQTMEKTLAKFYIPLKKFLQKELGVAFVDICNVVVNEDTYAIFGEKVKK